jgi:citrate lyase beta subunit
MIDISNIGASLYVPLTKFNPDKLFEKHPFIRSVILDCEDSVKEEEIHQLEQIIYTFLMNSDGTIKQYNRFIFLRVRNSDHFELIKKKNLGKFFNGILLPKFSYKTGFNYIENIEATDLLMPIVETDIFFNDDLKKTMKMVESIGQNIVCLRIGANDILNFFGQRRQENCTIYTNPIFNKYFTDVYIEAKQLNLSLSGPVYDYYSKSSFDTLDNEVNQELSFGIITKSAIHPIQVKRIQENYKISEIDLISSNQILNSDSPVSAYNNAMLEKSVHTKWAQNIKLRHVNYGLKK